MVFQIQTSYKYKRQHHEWPTLFKAMFYWFICNCGDFLWWPLVRGSTSILEAGFNLHLKLKFQWISRCHYWIHNLLVLVTLKFWPKSAILRSIENTPSYCTWFPREQTASLREVLIPLITRQSWLCLSDISTLGPNKECCTPFSLNTSLWCNTVILMLLYTVNDLIIFIPSTHRYRS